MGVAASREAQLADARAEVSAARRAGSQAARGEAARQQAEARTAIAHERDAARGPIADHANVLATDIAACSLSGRRSACRWRPFDDLARGRSPPPQADCAAMEDAPALLASARPLGAEEVAPARAALSRVLGP